MLFQRTRGSPNAPSSLSHLDTTKYSNREVSSRRRARGSPNFMPRSSKFFSLSLQVLRSVKDRPDLTSARREASCDNNYCQLGRGGGAPPPPLPHQPTCGSASGGSEGYAVG